MVNKIVQWQYQNFIKNNFWECGKKADPTFLEVDFLL